MDPLPDSFSLRRSQTLITAASYALVCGMLMLATLTVVQVGEALAPGWRGAAWVWLSPLLALEALLSARYLRPYAPLSREWLAYRLAEWVTLLLILRLVLYAAAGFEALRLDLGLPWREFASHFFSGAYLAWVVMGILVWVVAGEFAACLEPLEVDELAVALEREARSGPERQQARARLALVILALGAGLAFAAAVLRQDWLARLGDRAPLSIGGLNLVLYFVLGLVLLSLTQFSMLAMRWGINEYPVRGDVAQRWFLHGLGFLSLLGAIALLLPTAYAGGLLGALWIVIRFLISILGYVFFALLSPLILALNFLAQKMGEPPLTSTPNWKPPAPFPGSSSGRPPPGDFSEFLMALLFWFVFLGVIIFALRYYFSQHASTLEALQRIPILGYLLRTSRALWSWLRGVGRGLGEAVQETVQSVRKRASRRKPPGSGMRSGYLSLRRLPPRQQVFFFYQAYLRRSREQGLARLPAQTPEEYAAALQGQLPEVQTDLHGLTRQFEEARYSCHVIHPAQVSRVRQYWARIKQALRQYQPD